MKIKHSLVIFLMTVFFAVLVIPVFAAGPSEKLKRGLVNVISSPIEIPKEVHNYWIKGSEKTPLIIVWIVSGFVKGCAMTVARAGSGLWDIVSFPINLPRDYQPLLNPTYVWNDWPQREEGVRYYTIGGRSKP